MQKNSNHRVLARRLASDFTPAELKQVGGQGTSIAGTGSCDAQGRAEDIISVDTTPDADTYDCRP